LHFAAKTILPKASLALQVVYPFVGCHRPHVATLESAKLPKMIRDDEDRILHGLYYYRENIDEDVQVSSEQLLWLAMHPLGEGEAWNKDGKLQSLDPSEFPVEIRGKLITAKLELPLRYLQYRRLITYAKRSDGMLYAAVTFAGADRAIRLHTRRGRMDLWYREHRDGVVGVTITILISFITALVTILVVNRILRL
jgi:hypothetical protein